MATTGSRLRAILDTVHDAVIVMDEGGLIVDVNRATTALLGWPADALVGSPVTKLMPSREAREHAGYVKRYLDTAEPRIIGKGRRVMALHAEGHEVAVELAVSPFTESGERLFCGTMRDRSAEVVAEEESLAHRVRLEQVLAERTHKLDTSEQFLRSALDGLPVRVGLLDERDLRLVNANLAWHAQQPDAVVAGGRCALGESLGALLDAALDDPDAALLRSKLESLRGGQIPHFVLDYGARLDGVPRAYQLHASRFTCRRGTFVALTHTDVTALREATAEVERRETLLRAVIDNAPDTILVADENRRLEIVARATELELEGGERLDERAPVADLERLASLWRTLMDDGVPVEFDAGRDGRTYSVRGRRITMPDGAKKAIFFLTDITEKERAEAALAASVEQLRQSQKMHAIGQLAGGMAHDFNNLLAAIRFQAAFVAETLGAGSPVDDEIEQIQRATDRGSRLTSQLLAFGRARPLATSTLDLGAVIDELVPMLQRLVGSRIRLVTTREGASHWFRGDRGQLEQVLTNLVVNARDAIAHTGTIEIAVQSESVGEHGFVVCRIRDDGEGMPPEVRERIFEPFFTTKPQGQGTGLGLTMVYGIVTQSGGSLGVESTPGRGTVFELRFPAARRPTPVEGTRRAARQAPSRHTAVLVVEDDPVLRRAIVRIVEESGHEVVAAADAEAAEAALGTRSFGLLLTDVVMPDTTGLELAARARRSHPGLPILLVSGYAPDLAGSAPPVDLPFLAKPFSPRQLTEKIQEVLDTPMPPRDSSPPTS